MPYFSDSKEFSVLLVSVAIEKKIKKKKKKLQSWHSESEDNYDLQVNNPYGSAIFNLSCKNFAENIIKCTAIKNKIYTNRYLSLQES